jgi:hypothetical protein
MRKTEVAGSGAALIIAEAQGDGREQAREYVAMAMQIAAMTFVRGR